MYPFLKPRQFSSVPTKHAVMGTISDTNEHPSYYPISPDPDARVQQLYNITIFRGSKVLNSKTNEM